MTTPHTPRHATTLPTPDLRITDEHWAAVVNEADDGDLDEFGYGGVSARELADLLTTARDALTYGATPLLHELRHIDLYPGDASGTDVMITVRLAGTELRVTSGVPVSCSHFALQAPMPSGLTRARHALGEIVGYRNQLVADLATYLATAAAELSAELDDIAARYANGRGA